MAPTKGTGKYVFGKGKVSRRHQLAAAREQRRNSDKNRALEVSMAEVSTSHCEASACTSMAATDATNKVSLPSNLHFSNISATQSVDYGSQLQNMATSRRKLDYFAENDESNVPSTSTANVQSHISDSVLHDDSGLIESENFIMNAACLQNLCANAMCPACNSQSLTVKSKDRTLGLVMSFNLVCEACGHELGSAHSSQRIGNSSRNPFDVNRRAVNAFTNLGVGYAGMKKFCKIMDMPCMSESTFVQSAKCVSEASRETCEATLQESVEKVREAYKAMDSSITDQDIIDIAVSYDGTWQHRGYSSKFGVGICVDLVTGLVVDYEVKSKYCATCARKQSEMNTKSKEYQEWFAKHQPQCQKNHEGSSNSMEMAAAEVIWQRSVTKNNLRYTTVLSDGDAKTHSRLTALNVYGDEHPIKKEECINHVEKRLGTALRNARQSSSRQGITLGGRGFGKLTDATIKKLTAYYGKAIRNNTHDLDAMYNAIHAARLHSMSTDEEPKHDCCPKGPEDENWCFYNKAVAKGLTPGSHKDNIHTALRPDVAEAIKPIYDRLSSRSLLEKCTRAMTQNANESLHSTIWRICPKHLFVGKERVDGGVAMAIATFNKGQRAISEALLAQGISPGHNFQKAAQKEDQRRIKRSQKQSEDKEKKKRQARAIASVAAEQRLRNEEGLTYASGAFD